MDGLAIYTTDTLEETGGYTIDPCHLLYTVFDFETCE